jgi:beta-1,4-mannosyltransferase
VSLRVAAFPAPAGTNPYGRLLQAELARLDVELVEAATLDARWVRGPGATLDAIHLHWLEYLYGGDTLRAHRRAVRLVRALHAARGAGVRVVWTVHNLRPHEARRPWLDRVTAATAARCADALVVHSEHAAVRVREHLRPAAPIAVLPHPNYLGAYPPARGTREQERARLGVPQDAFVYLVFGHVRRYKRVPEVVRAFRAAADATARLVVAGGVLDERLRAEIEAARGGDLRVLLRLAPVPDDEVPGLHAAADAAVLHYRDVFSSGALLLALSFGLPVAGPRATTVTELCGHEAAVAYGPGGLERALGELRRGDRAARRAAALAVARTYDWRSYAEGIVALYGAGRPALAEAA